MKVFASYASDKELHLKYFLKILILVRQNGQKIRVDIFPKESIN